MTSPAGAAMCAFIPPFLRYLRDGLADENLSPARFQVLQVLAGGNELTMVGLADALCVTKRNVTALIDGLEKEDLVVRRAHPTDRRSKIISLSKRGERRFTEVAKVQQAHLEKLTAGLDPSQQQVLVDYLSQLTQAMLNQADELDPPHQEL
ncbi:MAG: MarR family transcriptional regulator [Pseudomonadota bacterium]